MDPQESFIQNKGHRQKRKKKQPKLLLVKLWRDLSKGRRVHTFSDFVYLIKI